MIVITDKFICRKINLQELFCNIYKKYCSQPPIFFPKKPPRILPNSAQEFSGSGKYTGGALLINVYFGQSRISRSLLVSKKAPWANFRVFSGIFGNFREIWPIFRPKKSRKRVPKPPFFQQKILHKNLLRIFIRPLFFSIKKIPNVFQFQIAKTSEHIPV